MPSIELLLEELQQHGLPTDHYVIAASGPIGVRRLRQISDLDLAVDSWLWELLSADREVESAQTGFSLSPHVEVFHECKFGPGEGLPTIEEQIADAEVIDGFPFLRLEHLLKLKAARSWPKDRADVRLIELWLEASGDE